MLCKCVFVYVCSYHRIRFCLAAAADVAAAAAAAADVALSTV